MKQPGIGIEEFAGIGIEEFAGIGIEEFAHFVVIPHRNEISKNFHDVDTLIRSNRRTHVYFLAVFIPLRMRLVNREDFCC
jgi:hypothetical protein